MKGRGGGNVMKPGSKGKLCSALGTTTTTTGERAEDVDRDFLVSRGRPRTERKRTPPRRRRRFDVSKGTDTHAIGYDTPPGASIPYYGRVVLATFGLFLVPTRRGSQSQLQTVRPRTSYVSHFVRGVPETPVCFSRSFRTSRDGVFCSIDHRFKDDDIRIAFLDFVWNEEIFWFYSDAFPSPPFFFDVRNRFSGCNSSPKRHVRRIYIRTNHHYHYFTRFFCFCIKWKNVEINLRLNFFDIDAICEK